MKRKTLRVERFLGEMDRIIPWDNLCHALSFKYQTGDGGRRAHDLKLMLKVHFLQLWHNLSDPGMEEALYDRLSFQKFVGFDCFGGVVPDESSILRFRHFLEEHNFSKKILEIVNDHLSKHGLILKEGTIVDATILEAPVSKKNKKKERDPEMSSTRKNNKWHFGAKGHIGVQANGKPLIHSTDFSTAKDADIKHMTSLFNGEEKAILGDSAYIAQVDKRGARHIGLYYGITDRGAHQHPLSKSQKKRNRKLASIRAKVEHPFRVIKDLWGHRKVRYKGLKKNASQFTMLCALSNLFFSRKELALTG